MTAKGGAAQLLPMQASVATSAQETVSFQPMPAAKANECSYRTSRLAQGWANEVLARSSIGTARAAGNSLYRVNCAVTGEGWGGHMLVPRPSAERNHLAHGTAIGEAGLNAAAATSRLLMPAAGPVVNPGSAFVNPALEANTPYARHRKADAVLLNPQPLPPVAPLTVPVPPQELSAPR
jgi:hypothetical protein